MRKQTTRKELRELFKNEPIVLKALNDSWDINHNKPKASKYKTREDLKEAFKNHPIILDALLKNWYPEKTCLGCSITFKQKHGQQKFCSRRCWEKKYRRKPLNERQKARKLFLEREQRKERATENRITKKCGMCGKEYIESKNIKSRTCGKKCTEDYNNYMNKVLSWD